jgi:hypothetical protein
MRLRQALYQTPGAGPWLEVRQALEGLSDPQQGALALDYARQHMQPWPWVVRRTWLEEDASPWSDPRALPWAPLVRALRLSLITWDEASMRAFVQAPASAMLRALSLTYMEFQEASHKLLREAPWLPQLEALTLARLEPPWATLRLLEALPEGCKLRALRMDGLWLEDLGPRLGRLRPLGLGLRRLVLHRANLGDRQLRELTQYLSAPGLHRLDLSHNYLTAHAVQALRCLGCDGLGSLLLRHNRLGDAGLEALASASWPLKLRRLDVSLNGAHGPGALALTLAPWFSRLSHLSLAHNSIEARTRRNLLEALPGRLVSLDLSGVGLTDRDMEALAACRLPRLRRLALGHNRLTARGLQALAQAPWFGRLRWLDMSHCRLGPQAGALLARHAQHLSHVNLEQAELGPRGVAALASAAPRLFWRRAALHDARGADPAHLEALLGMPRLKRLALRQAPEGRARRTLEVQARRRGVVLLTDD